MRSEIRTCGRRRIGPAAALHRRSGTGSSTSTTPAGLLTLLFEPDGGVEILSFGLVPGKQGRGRGGSALTTAVDLAWTTFGEQVSRVWLHTNNFDHPNTLPNYLKRGFVVVEKVVFP